MAEPNWAEQVTAIATAVGALGLLGAIGAALFAGQQVREERKTRQAHMAADFFRRWDEDELVEARRLVDQFEDGRALSEHSGDTGQATLPKHTSSTASWTSSNSWLPSNSRGPSTLT